MVKTFYWNPQKCGYSDVWCLVRQPPIGGSEHKFPSEHFCLVYEEAWNNDFRKAIHAGKAAGAASIWRAVSILRPDRIGHGVKAHEDVT